MSITSDLRAYAEQGRTQLNQVVDQAQTQLTDVTGEVSQRVSDVSAKATAAFGDLRTQAEKTLNIEAIKSAVEPYLAQAKGYGHSVTDRASGIVDSLTSDKRVAKVFETAEQVSGVVVETVNQRVVKPVLDLTGRGTTAKPKTARKSTAKKAPATKPASTRPAPSATKAPAAKSTARKSPAKKAAPSA